MDSKRKQDEHATPGAAASYPGMLGDETEEQNLDQPGNPDARITEDEVKEAFERKPAGSKPE